MSGIKKNLKKLSKEIDGELLLDDLSKVIYSTDASAYREKPLAVALPKIKNDLIKLVEFAKSNKTTLIPRATGTSLAGQVVGSGLVVDISRHFKKIIELNEEEHWVRVEPGVVLDELNIFLKPYGLFFGPETSTANRCCLGGMVGNNSCGSHSLVYGSTREHLISTKVILSSGEEIELKEVTKQEFKEKLKQDNLEGQIYKHINTIFSDKVLQKKIEDNFPEKEVRRRNNGYALDEIIDNEVFDSENDKKLNLAKLFAGSEGTLGIATELKLNLVPLPPIEKAVICVHFDNLEDSFDGNLIALYHKPVAIELMDNNILEAASRNIAQKKNMFFVEGEPKAILIIELAEETTQGLESKIKAVIEGFKDKNKGYAYPVLMGSEIGKVWDLRKAGLGLLTNIPGSAKPVSVIEDTAVNPKKMRDYIKEFKEILVKYNLSCVYHAHIATGELHLRPVLDLKSKKDVELFRTVSKEVALLVKKYRGSLSGEHGDGKLRGEWIPLMYGEEIYSLMKDLKKVWDKDNIFNKGKIIDTPPMDVSLRYSLDKKKKSILEDENFSTYYDFSKEKGLLSAVEQCNGSADCRKSSAFSGTMCPSYRATNDERFTPRARANALREYYTNPIKNNPFDNENLYWILDNCLSCKGCKTECPSNVDIAKLKSEFLQHYYKVNGVPLKVLLVTYLPLIQRIGSFCPKLYNWVVSNEITSKFIKKILYFAPQRDFPTLCNQTFVKIAKQFKSEEVKKQNKKIYLFADEFINYQDAEIGFDALRLFSSLGYEVEIAPIRESGRIPMSKGMVKRAKKLAKSNIKKLKEIISEKTPLVGLEPSTILSFRDEYPSLCKDAENISSSIFLFDEFLAKEIEKGNITQDSFSEENKQILLHGHCQQKALIGIEAMQKILSLPKNYKVEVIPSGCCGMAGSFGYDKDHYELSKKIGEMVLFPAVNSANEDVIISAPGTSCREHINHFTNREVLHPITVLLQSLK